MPTVLTLRSRRTCVVAAALLLFSLFFAVPLSAQWGINPLINTPVATATDAQQDPVIVDDGAGGAIIAWVDLRNVNGKDIYAQRADASGRLQWAPNGLLVCGEQSIQDAPAMIPDGSGGAFIVWEDKRADTTYDIYAQRISPSGAPVWAAAGVPVCVAAGDQQTPSIVSDGAGGAIIAWTDTRPDRASDIYAQRITPQGTVRWGADGVPVRKATLLNGFTAPAMISDGNRGAILSWDDVRKVETGIDIYAQRIDSAGISRWDTNAVALCAASADQYGAVLTSDGAGGVIAAWTDGRTAPNTGIYAQRINAAGALRWTLDGVVVNDTTDNQESPAIVSDRSGGAIISWSDKRGGATSDIYAQRIEGGTGSRQWNIGGVALCTVAGDQTGVRMVSDSVGGAVAVWTDRRGTDDDLYAQRVNGAGAVQWVANGVRVTSASGSQGPAAVALVSPRVAVAAWTDGRGGSDDIYAQNIDLSGALGLAPLLVAPSLGAGIGADSVRLAWSHVTPVATKYWLDVATDSAFVSRTTDSTLVDTAHVVRSLVTGQTYWWRVRAWDNAWGPFSAVSRFIRSTTAVQEQQGMPREFSLSQNYPNPFNPSTAIRYALPRGAAVRLVVYNLLGQQMAVLVNERQEAGYHEVVFQARNLASGVYFYRIEAGSFVQTKSLVLMK